MIFRRFLIGRSPYFVCPFMCPTFNVKLFENCTNENQLFWLTIHRSNVLKLSFVSLILILPSCWKVGYWSPLYENYENLLSNSLDSGTHSGFEQPGPANKEGHVACAKLGGHTIRGECPSNLGRVHVFYLFLWKSCFLFYGVFANPFLIKNEKKLY